MIMEELNSLHPMRKRRTKEQQCLEKNGKKTNTKASQNSQENAAVKKKCIAAAIAIQPIYFNMKIKPLKVIFLANYLLLSSEEVYCLKWESTTVCTNAKGYNTIMRLYFLFPLTL